MPNAEQLQELITEIYDAGLTPSRWPSAIERIARSFDATSADFHGWNRETRTPEFAITYNMDHLVPDYAAHYIHINPRIAFLENDPKQRRIFYDYLFTRERDINNGEFYTWIEKEGDARYCLGMRVEDTPIRQSVFGIHSNRKQGHAHPEMIRQFEALAPHLTRAVQISRRIGGLERRADILENMLEFMRCAVLLVNSRAEVRFANHAARGILELRDGIAKDERDELRASRMKATQELRAAIAAAAQPQNMASTASRLSLLVKRPSGATPYEILVTPAPESSMPHATNDACVMLLISHPDAPTRLPIALLEAHYGLTPAEIRLCEALIASGGTSDLPQLLGIAESTARSRLKQVYVKTGTNKQADLVALLYRHRRDWRDS